MRRWPSLILAASLLAGCLMLGILYGEPSRGQDAENPPRLDARYQVALGRDQSRGATIVVIDTRTGHCWTRQAYGAGSWNNLGSPVKGQ